MVKDTLKMILKIWDSKIKGKELNPCLICFNYPMPSTFQNVGIEPYTYLL